jgi:hypothetical protein
VQKYFLILTLLISSKTIVAQTDLDEQFFPRPVRAICTPGENQLILMSSGEEFYDYTSNTSCEKGLRELRLYRGICTPLDNILIFDNGREFHDYYSNVHCLAALRQLNYYGATCMPNDNRLLLKSGRELYDYTSNTSCLKGPEQLGRAF